MKNVQRLCPKSRPDPRYLSIGFIDPYGDFMLVTEFDKNAQYGSLALVWNGWLPDGVYLMKTRADVTGTNAAARSGLYDYKLEKYKGKFFAEHDALEINKGQAVPTVAPNINKTQKHCGQCIATGIHAHAGNPLKPDNRGVSGSTGCWTVPTVIGPIKDPNYYKKPEMWTYYNKFIENFKDPQYKEGKVLLLRRGSIEFFLTPLFPFLPYVP